MKFDLRKPCDSCPFRRDSKLDGAPDWAMDVLKGIRGGRLSHTCHKTDPKADGFKNTKSVQACIGYLGVLKNMGELAIAVDDGELLAALESLSTDGVWRSVDEMLIAYLRKYCDEGLLSPAIAAAVDAHLAVIECSERSSNRGGSHDDDSSRAERTQATH